MSYTTYTTEALVCGTWNRNTADRSYLLFTREAGMLYADARSVREERSRQRYALQDFARIRVSLVKGKQGWKIGSVEAEKNDFFAASTKEVRGSVVGLHRLLRRYIHGEESSPELFDFCVEALDHLQKPLAKRTFIEAYTAVQILAMLGYVDETALPQVIKANSLADLVDHNDDTLEAELNKLIQNAASHSQL